MLELNAERIPDISMRVKFRKLREAPGSPCPAAKWESFVPGQVGREDESLPDAYELEGELLAPLVIGQPILIRRTSRNGVAVEGLFTSTPAEEIGDGWVRTNNSIYKMALLTEASSAPHPRESR